VSGARGFHPCSAATAAGGVGTPTLGDAFRTALTSELVRS
jgi:hypothetical protein